MTFGLTDVTVRFGSTVALAGVTLAVPAGEVTGVVGGDGAGKTTLLRTLVGDVQPTAGTVHAPPAARTGYLTAAAGSWADLTVAENVAFVGASFRLGRAELGARADRLLDRAGLADVRGRLARELSGGMRRKLGFCLAMLAGPELLVLDEPSTGVDPVSRVDLWQLVSEAAASGTAVLMSTTYLDEAERCASLAVLDEGHVLVSGPPDDVLASLAGTVVSVATPTHPERAWRRGREHHEWWPPNEAPVGTAVAADLEDVVIAAALARRGAGTAR